MGKKERAAVGLSRRERQIMDILYKEEEASAKKVMNAMPDAPGYSAVRALLRILVEKGYVRYRRNGPRYTYQPVVPKKQAEESALKHMVETFFENSVENAVAALLGASELDPDELDRLSRLIEDAKSRGDSS
jgi:predicted transcriptional regulator